MDHVIIKRNKRRKNYALSVTVEGDIVVRTPWNVSNTMVKQLIHDHQDWIATQRHKQASVQRRQVEWHHHDTIMYRGTQRSLAQSPTQSVRFYADRIELPATLTKLDFLDQHARLYLIERCRDLAETMGVTVPKIRIRHMVSRWGTCHQQGTITLNSLLIQTPDWVSDYVMIHECAHRIHFNHSADFWALVAEYTPHTSAAKQWLRDHQDILKPPATK